MSAAPRDIARRLESGRSLRAIANDLGVSPTTVMRWRRELTDESADPLMAHDNPQQIARCLACNSPFCRGECRDVLRLRS